MEGRADTSQEGKTYHSGRGKTHPGLCSRNIGRIHGKIGQLNAINANATQEVKEKLQTGEMGITSAYAASQLDPESQKKVVSRIESGEDVRSEEIQRIIEEKRKQQAEEAEGREEELDPDDEQDQEKEQPSSQEKQVRKIEDQQRQPNVSDTDTNEDEKATPKGFMHLRCWRSIIPLCQERNWNYWSAFRGLKRRKREYAMDED